MSISRSLIKWYQLNHRNLPWRETDDPYAIWLSEILLQQTRVDQGLPYYYRFLTSFPTVKQLADADNDLIMKHWQGLGYYSRARNLHKAAQIIVKNYNSTFPCDFQLLKSLPGVGDYTASAIASFAFNLPFAVLDGNVYRVLSRLFDAVIPIDSPEGKKYFSLLADKLLDKKNPGIHNQAIMEFGAMQCKPANPNCNTCVLKTECKAFKNNTAAFLPVKSKKTKIRKRYFNYLLIRHKDSIFMNYRNAGDIWHNLYDLPLIETDKDIQLESIRLNDTWKSLFKDKRVHINNVSGRKPHKLSHQLIHTKLFDLTIDFEPTSVFNKYKKVHTQDIVKYAVPKVIESILEENFDFYSKTNE